MHRTTKCQNKKDKCILQLTAREYASDFEWNWIKMLRMQFSLFPFIRNAYKFSLDKPLIKWMWKLGCPSLPQRTAPRWNGPYLHQVMVFVIMVIQLLRPFIWFSADRARMQRFRRPLKTLIMGIRMHFQVGGNFEKFPTTRLRTCVRLILSRLKKNSINLFDNVRNASQEEWTHVCLEMAIQLLCVHKFSRALRTFVV